MFGAGDDFIATAQLGGTLRFDPPFSTGDEGDHPPLTAEHRGQSCIALAACGTYCAAVLAAPVHGIGIQQSLVIYEVDVLRSRQLHQTWAAKLPPQLYVPDATYAQLASNDDNEHTQQSSSASSVVLCLERGGNGAVAIAWGSTDVAVVIEPPVANSPGGALVVCRKRLEHAPSCLALGGDLLFTLSGPSGRLQSWDRHSGSISRDAGTLSALHRVSCVTYEASEAMLIVGFESGIIRLVSVERNANMVALVSLDVAASTFGSASPILTASFAQRATGDVLLVCERGIATLNLRTQQLAKARYSFAENGNSTAAGPVTFAAVSTRSEFAVVMSSNGDGGLEVISVASAAKPREAQHQQQQQRTNNTSLRIAKWEHRVPVRGDGSSPQLAVHDDMSEISFAASDATAGVAAATALQMPFDIAQHSNISYDGDNDDNEDDADDVVEEDEEFAVDCQAEEDQEQQEDPKPAVVVAPTTAQWQQPSQQQRQPQRPAPKAAPMKLAAGKKAPAPKPGGKIGSPPQQQQQQSEPPVHDITLPAGNPLFAIPTTQLKTEQLSAVFTQPFDLAQEKADPTAKPVTFKRGGPIKSSGYSASANVPWSVQQAEKKRKLLLAQQRAKKAAQPISSNNVPIVALANYNTACGVTNTESDKATAVFDQHPLHTASVTCAAFDLLGSVLVTGSADGTAHILKLPVVRNDGQGVGINASVSTGAVLSGIGATALSSGAASSKATAAVASPAVSSTSAAATTESSSSSIPVLSIDVGASGFDPLRPQVALSRAPSWNLFVTGSVGGAVTIWTPSAQTGAAPRIRHTFSRDIRSVRFAMRDSLLLAASGGAINICRFAVDNMRNTDDLHRGRNLSRFAVVHEFKAEAQSVLCMDTFNTFDSALVAFGTSSKQVGVLDLRRPDTTSWAVDEAHQRPVHNIALQRCSAFASDPYSGSCDIMALFATSAADSCVKLWDVRSKAVARTLNKHANTALPLGLCLSPCGRFVACGSEDRAVCVYDVGTGQVLAKMRVPDNALSLRYHPLKPVLVAGLANGKARLFVEASS